MWDNNTDDERFSETFQPTDNEGWICKSSESYSFDDNDNNDNNVIDNTINNNLGNPDLLPFTSNSP